MDKELNRGGTTYDHWVHSTVAFSVIINLVTAKLFLETSYWNIINMYGTCNPRTCLIEWLPSFLL